MVSYTQVRATLPPVGGGVRKGETHVHLISTFQRALPKNSVTCCGFAGRAAALSVPRPCRLLHELRDVTREHLVHLVHQALVQALEPGNILDLAQRSTELFHLFIFGRLCGTTGRKTRGGRAQRGTQKTIHRKEGLAGRREGDMGHSNTVITHNCSLTLRKKAWQGGGGGGGRAVLYLR